MISLTPACVILKATGFRHCQGVLEFAALAEAPRVVPALFVIPSTDSAQPNRMNGVHDQKVALSFDVVLVLGGAARADGKASDELTQQVSRIVQALIGVMLPGASSAIEYAGGRLLSADISRVAWAIRFTCGYHLRKAPQ